MFIAQNTSNVLSPHRHSFCSPLNIIIIIATIETIFPLRVSIVGPSLFYKLVTNAMLCFSKTIQNNTTDRTVVSITYDCTPIFSVGLVIMDYNIYNVIITQWAIHFIHLTYPLLAVYHHDYYNSDIYNNGFLLQYNTTHATRTYRSTTLSLDAQNTPKHGQFLKTQLSSDLLSVKKTPTQSTNFPITYTYSINFKNL